MADAAQAWTREILTKRVIDIVEEQLGVDREEITLNATFKDDLGCDSLDNIELVMACEEEFGVEISDADMEACDTVGKVVDHLANILNARK